MIQRLSKRFLSMLLVTVMILGLVPVIAAPAFAATSGTLTGLTDEKIGLSFSGSTDENAWSASGTKITGSVVSVSVLGGCDDHYDSTLTIKNNKGAKATLSFDYAIEQNSGTIKVDGNEVTANGSYSVELDSGASKTVYIKSGSTVATKITITNISLVLDVPFTVKFVPAENGTYAVDGKTITEAWENTQKATQAYKLVATPNDGYMFLGWYNVTNGKCMSTDASVKLSIESDCSFAAKFVPKGTTLFETGGQPFADLNEAVNYARDNNKDKITLIADGAISGNYDIPAGITLLIPFDDAGTLYTDSPAAIRTTPASKPFRTLTMVAGSSITVNGAISIGGRYFAAGGGQQGRPIGDHGYIKMASGSSITVKNGGNLYAWGFISGDGSVTAESGATVYEFYQIADFRGGNASSNMGNKVFPFSQYFIQNIEVPLTLNAGATEKVFSGVFAMSKTFTTTINFIGSGGMFNIKSGSFTKDYDENRDRLILTVNGEAELNTLALQLAGMSVNSAEYVLPMTNNITINIDSGSVTINQDTALLAGVEVNIAEGAGLTVASGKNVYVYDADEWNSDNFVWGSCKFKSVAYAPGKAYNRSNSDLTDAKINVDGTLTAIGAVYTTAGGADICSEGGTGKYIQQGTPGTETTTYQYDGNSNSKSHEFTITPAKLRNADGTYFETATVEAGTTVNYYKEYGIWHSHDIDAEIRDAKAETCTENGYSGDTYCKTCDMKIKDGNTINAHHTLKYHDKVEPTCTATGMEEYWECTVCKNLYADEDCTKLVEKLDDLKIDAKAHTPGAAVRENVVDSTCTVKGSYDEVVYCEACKKELTRESKTLPAMGHTRGEAVRENVIDSTCADEGSCDEVVYCEVCKKELSRDPKIIEKKAHTPFDVAEVPATCTEDGHKAGTKCDVCGATITGLETIPATGHTEVIRNAKPATDTEDGYTGDVYCEVCNELLRNGEIIPATHVKITWIINGVKHETVCAKGDIPVYDGETPAKPETSRFTYEFKGWDKEIVAATENAEYTAEFTAIGKNGLCIEGDDTFWIKDGVNIAFPGLIRIADANGHIHYYYFAEDGKAVKNGNYKVNKNNGLPLPEYGFAFDSDGVIVHDEDTSKNGICDGDGSKFYYIDGVKVGEGLIKVGDYYYYARTSSGEIVRNRQYWITKTNELPMQQGIFDFDAEGRMIVTGFIHAFGTTYYYDNGVLAKGFTKIGDDYYIFNASSGKMYSNAMMWVPDNEYGITGGMYEFDADGKMIRTGFITTGGYTYYYDNGVLAKGFTKIGDDYYFFNAGSGKMYRDATLWVADNAEYGFVGGMYYFGADGKIVLPDIENGKKSIVTINGKKYLTIDGAYAPTSLYEIDGNCYYVKAAGELAVSETVWVDNKNGLIPAKGDWRAFDAEGKLIHTGFVTGGDGYVYHYTDDVLSLGFTCIDGEYYLFNAGSGKMYRDANMWVGPNDYGIVGGMYYFDANGKMAR